MKNRSLMVSLSLGLSLAAVPQSHAQFAQSIAPLVMAQSSSVEKPGQARAATNDRDVALRVQSAIFKDKRVSGLGLAVKANDGTVELSGRADNRSQADRAVAIARAVPGVKSVTNEIRVN